jgi:Exoribonuclease R
MQQQPSFPRHSDAEELAALARQAMIERGLEPEFPPDALQQATQAAAAFPPAEAADPAVRDLRALPWASVDNDDSRDLDQLTVAEPQAGGKVRILVAVADVDALVKDGSPADRHARKNTTSVYTPAVIFPMLPEQFSTDLSSLNPGEDRLALVVAYTVNEDGRLSDEEVFRALVRNHAKLAYPSVGAWLEGAGPMPPAMAAAPPVIAEQIALQDRVAGWLRARREEEGALELQTIEPRTAFRDGQVADLYEDDEERAHALIEDFMIAANGVTTRFLNRSGFPTFRRVVATPERWDRLQRLAREYGERLPAEPDSAALNAFLVRRRKADPLRFPDLSLTVVKMMGAGEYRAQGPGRRGEGHFGLAVRDYSHSTAPNRRYPDLITHRLVKAALAGQAPPYTLAELTVLAEHCTLQEDMAKKVERQVRKSAAALLLRDRVGATFEGLVTGASSKGVWVRTLKPPVEGRIISGEHGLDVGDRVRVTLKRVDVTQGYIDFARVERVARR